MKAWEQKAAKQIGLNLKVLRTRRELSQDDLGDLIGMKRSYLSEIENGKRNLSLTTLFKLARALKCQMTELFEGVRIRSR